MSLVHRRYGFGSSSRKVQNQGRCVRMEFASKEWNPSIPNTVSAYELVHFNVGELPKSSKLRQKRLWHAGCR